ncbi:Crp/Fnr family transcriptional regulator [Haploplasma axanthum]|uniref:Fumarate and nitrate reduction regulatory protein n=1 Tax=Haploplasma axanthum TaxID=29552 RepID=A0A449BG58_HAPAX|nr:Crp/Fnr family transcriptional regulator [Haploplasma axanthum]VEU81280.1 Fumarate and nitrate reduction regulatory protein [Haploplasma axanthum]
MLSKHEKSCLFKVPIFNHLNENEQADISNLIRVKRLLKGDFLYHMGDTGAALYVVHQGKIKIARYNDDGNEQVIRILNPGDFLGEELLFTNIKANNFAVSLEDSAVCMLEGSKLKEYIMDKPQIGIRMLSELSTRLSESDNKIESYNLDLSEKRIVASILKLSKGNHIFTLPFSKSDWASILGMSSETLSRNLAELKKSNLIELEGQRTIKIINHDNLKRFANE